MGETGGFLGWKIPVIVYGGVKPHGKINMFDEIKFTEITKQLTDCEYSLGDTSRGFDCLSMILKIYRDMGVKFPDSWDGWTEQNYAERWNKGEGREEFLQWLSQLGKRVDSNFIRKGDVIIFNRNGFIGPGIYLGNDLVFRIYDGDIKGGKISPLRHFRNSIVDVRRLV